jgi:hypothetical protein
MISFENLLKIFPRFASNAPLKRLTFDHLLCPAILRVKQNQFGTEFKLVPATHLQAMSETEEFLERTAD